MRDSFVSEQLALDSDGIGSAAEWPSGDVGDVVGTAALAWPGHVYYDRLQPILIAAGFDSFVEELCASHCAVVRGRPSLPPGRYFRMLLISYFEGIGSERGLEWRCADSLSLREFLRLAERETVPDHSWLSRTRSRLPLELHEQVYTGRCTVCPSTV
jgi:transposase